MLSLPDYMRRVDTKLEPANVIGSFLAAKKYASDEAYKKGQSELAKQQFEANEKYRAQQMDLQKQELKTRRENTLLNLQAQNFQAYSNQVLRLNLPDDQKMDLLNQAMSGMPEYYEAMGRPKPMITPKGNLYYNKEGVIDQALIDSLNLSEEGKSLLMRNKGRRFSADFVQKQDGQVQFMGTPKIFDVSQEKDYLPDMGDFGSIYIAVSKLKDLAGAPLYKTSDDRIKATLEAVDSGFNFVKKLRNQGIDIPDKIYEELGDKTEVKDEPGINQEQAELEQYFQDVTGEAYSSTDPQDIALMEAKQRSAERAESKQVERRESIRNEIQEAKAEFDSNIKRTTGPGSPLYKRYQAEYEAKLDFLRKKIQKEFKAPPTSTKASTGVEFKFKGA